MADAAAKRGHETRDINDRVVAWSALVLISVTVVVFFVISGLSRRLAPHYPSPEAASRIELHPRMLAPAPQLQVLPPADLERFRAQEDAQLNSYGWVDKPNGIVRIPIARAMELIAQRGLPVRGSTTPDSSGITPEQMQQQKATATAPARTEGKP